MTIFHHLQELSTNILTFWNLENNLLQITMHMSLFLVQENLTTIGFSVLSQPSDIVPASYCLWNESYFKLAEVPKL
jgi:hypothetical protein